MAASRLPDPDLAKLYFYYSAMNAGKTTTLLQSAHNYHERGMRTLILTPRLDDRFGEGVVASRIGLKARGTIFGRDDDLQAHGRRRHRRQGPAALRAGGRGAVPVARRRCGSSPTSSTG